MLQSVELIQNSCTLSSTASEQLHKKQAVSMVSADVGLVSMVRQGILALQLLPPNSSSGMFSLMAHITLKIMQKLLEAWKVCSKNGKCKLKLKFKSPQQ